MRGYRFFHIIVIMLALTACTADHEAMRQRLQYVSDCNRADTVFTERWLPTVDSLVSYFDRHGSANDRMMAYYVQGRVHHDMGEAPQALECYQKAAEQADTSRSDCDFLQLSRIYAQTAHLFLQQNLPENAISVLAKASHNAMIAQDSATYISCIEMESMALYELQQYNEAILRGEEVFRYNIVRKDSLSAYIALRLAILSAQKADSIKIADKWLTLYEDSSGLVDRDLHALKGHEFYYVLKGTSCLSKKNDKQAEFYFQALLASSNNLGMRARAYQGLYEAYRNLHHLDSMAKYAVLYSQYNDSTTNALRIKELQQQASLYNYSRQQQVAEEKKREARSWMAGAITTVMVALLAITLLLVLFYRTKARRLQEINDLKEVKENLESLLEEKEKSADVISQEIIRLNNKNSSISKTHQETVGRLQKQIEALQQKLLDTMKTTARDADSEQFVIGFKNRLQKYHHDDQPPTEAEWNQLERAFARQSGYMFVTSHQGMKQEHIRVCLMTVIDISESMMAYALKTDAKRIDRVKRQANKRLFGEDKASSLKSNLRPYFE